MSATLPFRIGTGVDVHAYDDTVTLRLAGLTWPDEPGLSGHSDGDAVCHAIVDALLSAAGLGTIGDLVGVDDPAFAHADSTEIVTRATDLLSTHSWRIVNVSVQVIGNHPRFSPRRSEAEARLSSLIGAPVSVGATTTDHLGFTGRGEGLAVIATALIATSE